MHFEAVQLLPLCRSGPRLSYRQLNPIVFVVFRFMNFFADSLVKGGEIIACQTKQPYAFTPDASQIVPDMFLFLV